MKFQDDISNMNTYVHTYIHTYGQAETNMPPHFFKVGGIKITPDDPKNERRLIQMIRMGKSIRHKWVQIRKCLNTYF